ncbi:hypothetical protein B0H11DRAFT_1991056 [Mycena galericulata]|nr:hypothetical protein B0H11DRAFT_1991056 [Mycena galericulata]
MSTQAIVRRVVTSIQVARMARRTTFHRPTSLLVRTMSTRDLSPLDAAKSEKENRGNTLAEVTGAATGGVVYGALASSRPERQAKKKEDKDSGSDGGAGGSASGDSGFVLDDSHSTPPDEGLDAGDVGGAGDSDVPDISGIADALGGIFSAS